MEAYATREYLVRQRLAASWVIRDDNGFDSVNLDDLTAEGVLEEGGPGIGLHQQDNGQKDTCFCQEPGAGFNGMQRSVSRSAGEVSSGEFR